MYELRHGRYGLAVLAMITMWFLWYIGNYGFLGDAATLLSANGLGIGSSILYLAVGAIGYPAGAAIMIVTADKVERKYLILGATVFWLAGMLLIGTLANGAVVTAAAAGRISEDRAGVRFIGRSPREATCSPLRPTAGSEALPSPLPGPATRGRTSPHVQMRHS